MFPLDVLVIGNVWFYAVPDAGLGGRDWHFRDGTVVKLLDSADVWRPLFRVCGTTLFSGLP